jgi:YggT family protein
MFVLANFLSALAHVLSIAFSALIGIIVCRALISWVNPDPNNTIVQILYSISEPFLAPVRRILPFSLRFGLDLSPLIVLLVVYFLKSFLITTLFDLAWKLKAF